MLLKKFRLFNAVICIITVLSILSCMMPVQKVSAEGEDKSLTLVCVSGDVVLAGMQWKLYKVGQRRSTEQNFVQTGDFGSFQVNLRNLTIERVTEAAQSFQAYAIANKITPLREGATDQNGEITFSGLSTGLYLVTGKLLKIDHDYYVPTTSLIEIKENDDNLRYDAYPKFSYKVMNETPRNYTVMKSWQNDEDRLEERPSSVIVDIYKDEEYYDSVVLSEENKWRYRWIDPQGVSSWIVMEKEVPIGYEMNLVYDVNNDSHFLIENSYFEDAGGTTAPADKNTTTTAPVSNATVTMTTTTVSGQLGDGSATRTGTNTATTVSGQLGDGSATRTGTNTATTVSGQLGDGSATRTGTETTVSAPVGNGTVTRTGTGTPQQSNGQTTSASPSGNNGNSSGGNGKLPQTGQLWWPILPLSIGGMILVAGGLAIRPRKKSDE